MTARSGIGISDLCDDGRLIHSTADGLEAPVVSFVSFWLPFSSRCLSFSSIWMFLVAITWSGMNKLFVTEIKPVDEIHITRSRQFLSHTNDTWCPRLPCTLVENAASILLEFEAAEKQPEDAKRRLEVNKR